jgi:hypothetical protein
MAQNVAANATVSEGVVTNSVRENVNEVDNASNNVLYQNIIKKLIASGCKRINSVRIKNVNFTEKDNYTMISFTLATDIRGFVSKDGGVTYEEGQTNTVFTSLYAIVGALKEDEELGWMANALLENPQALNLIFNNSTVDILQQEVSAGEEFRNPFSTREDIESQVYDHNLIINHILGFKLGKVGMKMADRLADKLMGF